MVYVKNLESKCELCISDGEDLKGYVQRQILDTVIYLLPSDIFVQAGDMRKPSHEEAFELHPSGKDWDG